MRRLVEIGNRHPSGSSCADADSSGGDQPIRLLVEDSDSIELSPIRADCPRTTTAVVNSFRLEAAAASSRTDAKAVGVRKRRHDVVAVVETAEPLDCN